MFGRMFRSKSAAIMVEGRLGFGRHWSQPSGARNVVAESHTDVVYVIGRLPWLAAAAAILLSLPALTVGVHSDDLAHALAVRGASPFPAQNASVLHLFTFADGDPQTNLAAMRRGVLPWWTDPRLRMSFCRPLSAVTHWLDFRFLDGRPALMHAQNVLWLGLMAALAAVLYRRIAGAGAFAVLAALMFAVNDAHGGAVGWISGRNGLIATSLALLALLAHDAWRREGRRWCGLAAPLALAAALLSGEAAVPIGGYLLAYALFLDGGGWRQRVLSLLVYAPVVAGWRLFYAWGGYGAYGSGTYIDPVQEPARFVESVLVRGPIQILATWAFPYSDVFEQLSVSGAWLMWSAAVGVCVLIANVLWPLLRSDAGARFWALGMLLAAVPNAATIPADRILILVSFGAHALIGRLLVDAVGALRTYWPAPATSRSGFVRGFGGRTLTAAGVAMLVAIHLVAAPILLPVRAAAERHGRSHGLRFVEALEGEPDVAQRQVIVANAPGAWFGPLFLINRAYHGAAVPEALTLLANGLQALDITRLDAQTMRVRPVHGFLVPPRTPPNADNPKLLDLSYRLQQSDRAFRRRATDMPVGHRVVLGAVTVEIVSLTADGRPAEADFHFDAPLDDSKWIWLAWRGGRCTPWRPPEVGATVRLEASR